MPLDLRKYDQKPAQWEWAAQAEKRLTESGLAKMQNAMYNTLLEMKQGQFFDIETKVQPENHEIFIKTVCEFLAYFPNYRFNRLMNRVYHDFPILMPLKKTATDEERKERQRMERERRRLLA